MSPQLVAKMRRNAERARAVGVSQCLFAALLVATHRMKTRDVVPQVEVAVECFNAALELVEAQPCRS